jgi:hypothetical protein
MSRRPNRTRLSTFGDGTTCARVYPRGTTMEQSHDTEPIFEVWRDAQGNVIDCPDPERYPEFPWPIRSRQKTPEGIEDETQWRREKHRILDKWRRSEEYRNREAEAAERARRQMRLTAEEYQRYRAAVREHFDIKIWQPGPAHRPQPEDFRGTSP